MHSQRLQKLFEADASGLTRIKSSGQPDAHLERVIRRERATMDAVARLEAGEALEVGTALVARLIPRLPRGRESFINGIPITRDAEGAYRIRDRALSQRQVIAALMGEGLPPRRKRLPKLPGYLRVA